MNTDKDSCAFGARRTSVFICVHLRFKTHKETRHYRKSLVWLDLSAPLRLCGEST